MTNTNFPDLKRRYLEKNEVSEFQRLWSIFNPWLKQYTGKVTDRDCIEDIKQSTKLQSWVEQIINSSVPPISDSIYNGLHGSFPRFASNNIISEMFKFVRNSSVIEQRINYPWRPGSDSRVKQTNAIILNDEQFIKAYKLHAQVLEEGISDFNLTIHQTLPSLGIHTTGCCCFRGEVDNSLPTSTNRWADRMMNLFRNEEVLDELVNLADSSHITKLSHDIIETLYNIRNVAIHGDLDFLNKNDNAAARAGYDVLDSLINNIIDHW